MSDQARQAFEVWAEVNGLHGYLACSESGVYYEAATDTAWRAYAAGLREGAQRCAQACEALKRHDGQCNVCSKVQTCAAACRKIAEGQ